MPSTKNYARILAPFTARKNAAVKIQRAFRKKRATTSVVKRVLINQEPYKYNMISLNNTIPNRWTNLANLTKIAWSNTNKPSFRQSTKVQIKNFALRGYLTPGNGDVFNIVRLAIVRGRRAGELSMSDVSFDPNVTTDDLYLPFNQRYVDVLWSKTYSIQETTAGAVYPPFRIIDKNRKMNTTCKYEQALDSALTLDVQPYNNSAYFLIAVSDSGFVNHPTLAGQLRISWKDLD